jgi:PKD repeat protein
MKKIIYTQVIALIFMFVMVFQTSAQTYCTPGTNDPSFMGISDFTFGQYDNITGVNNNYSYFPTSASINVATGGNYLLSITGYSYNQNFYVWVDWNHNGIFTDSGEFYNLANSTTLYSDSFNIPLTATLGTTRMRVQSEYDGSSPISDPCATLQYGETEDYDLTVSVPAIASINSVVLARQNILSGDTVTISWQNTNVSSVNIDVAYDGSNYSNVYTNVPVSDGSYSYLWTVPYYIYGNNPNSIIRVSDPNSSAVNYSSSFLVNNFTIVAPLANDVVTQGQSFNVQWQGTYSYNYANIDYSTDGGSSWNSYASSVTSNTGLNTYPVTLSFSNDSISVLLRVTSTDLADFSISGTFKAVKPAISYCTPGTYNTCCMGIENFTFDQYSNYTGDFNNIYSYFPVSNSITAVTGQSYAMSITGFYNLQNFYVWVDWNHNGSFTDSGEFYNLANYTYNYSGNFQVPANALKGITRMRVMSEYAYSDPVTDPCVYLQYGETEDYELNVSAPTAQPVNVTIDVTVPASVNQVFLPGSYNGWNPAANQMAQIDSTGAGKKFEATILADTSTLEFKFCAGPSWYYQQDSVQYKANFKYSVDGGNITVNSFDPIIATVGDIAINIAVPAGTVEVFVAWSYNGWDLQTAIKAIRNSDGTFTAILPQVDSVQYKCLSFNADWSYVEKDSIGNDINNRTANFSVSSVENIMVANWGNLYQPTVTIDVTVPASVNQVFLPGSYNGWNPAANQMAQIDSTGAGKKFEATILADTSTLEFKFCAGPSFYYQQDSVQYKANFNYITDGGNITVNSFDPIIPTVGDITINISVPAGTVEVFVAGSYNGWDLQTAIKAFRNSDGTFTAIIPQVDSVQYKCLSFNADWSYVEKDSIGNDINNRTANFSTSSVENIIVANWGNLYQPTVTIDVTVPSNVNQVFLPGSYNGWDPAANQMSLISSNGSQNFFEETIFADASTLEFKFCAGPSWYYQQDSVQYKANFNYSVDGGNITVNSFDPKANSIYTFDYPASGATFTAGDNTYVSFNSSFGYYTTADLYLSTDGGVNYSFINSAYVNPGNYLDYYTIPQNTQYSNNCLLKLVNDSDANNFTISDMFTIQGAQPFLNLSQVPNQGDWWVAGNQYTIEWNSLNIATVNILLSKDYGMTWTSLVSNDSCVNGINSYTLNIDASEITNSAMIQVASTDGNYSQKTAVFVISGQSPNFHILLPRTGTTVNSGKILNIVFDYNGPQNNGTPNVYLYLTYDGTNWQYIASVNANFGRTAYQYALPESDVMTSQARVYLVNADNSGMADTSNSFTINATQPYINVQSPGPGWIYYANSNNQTVTWNSFGVSNVKIEFSNDNQATWQPVEASYISNDGSNQDNSPFYIPDTNSSNCYYRVTDIDNPSIVGYSPAFISSDMPDTVFFSSPNAGDVYTAGNYVPISFRYQGRWRSNQILNVLYSLDGGITKTLIQSVGLNWGDNFVSWYIPYNFDSASNVKIFIEAPIETNTDSLNIASQPFGINAIQPAVWVYSPDYNAYWYPGQNYYVNWYGQKVDSVIIDLSTDAGKTWNNLVPSTADQYVWITAPNVSPTDSAQVRVRSLKDSSVAAYSSLFTISNLPPSITIQDPGGNTLTAGKSYRAKVFYNGSSSGEYFKLSLFDIKNQVSYDINSDLNSNSSIQKGLSLINYTIPAGFNGSDSCALIINDYYFSWQYNCYTDYWGYYYCNWNYTQVNGNLIDTSASFKVLPAPPAINIQSPYAGSFFISGSQAYLYWASTNIDTVKLEYSLDLGLTWNLIQDNLPNNVDYGNYYWTIPPVNNEIDNCLVRVTSDKNKNVFDVSQAFTISNVYPQFTILSPNGGEQLKAGTSNYIKFNYSGNGGNGATLDWSSDDGLTWNNFGYVQQFNKGDNYFLWDIPAYQYASSFYKIRISNYGKEGGEVGSNISDESDSTFSILSGSSSLAINNPSMSDGYLKPGDWKYLSWNSALVDFVDVDYSLDGGDTWNQLYQFYPSSNGFNSLGWYVPYYNGIADNSIMRIINSEDSSIFAISKFIVSNIPGYLEILNPNDSTVWNSGEYQTIDFNVVGLPTNVKPNYYLKYGNKTVNLNQPNDSLGNNLQQGKNSFSFILPDSIPGTKLAFVQISAGDATNGGIKTYNSRNFTINAATPSISISNPNSTSFFVGGDVKQIQWYSINAGKVNIDYSSDDTTWISIKSGYTTKTGNSSIDWKVPDISTLNAIVRITSIDVANLSATTQPFSIYNGTVNLTLTTPNGGEVYNAGTSFNIKFFYTGGFDKISVSLSPDNGVTWNQAATINSIPDSNSFSFNIPVAISPSNNYLMKLSDSKGNEAISQNVFSIKLAKSFINVTKPVFADRLMSGSTAVIGWNSIGANVVNIAYSADSGKNWYPAKDSLPVFGNNGTYNWTVPAVSGTFTSLIKVTSRQDNTISGISQAFYISNVPIAFTIAQPNGGEKFQAGTNQNISFGYNGFKNIEINLFISTDSGSTWSKFTNTTNTKYYALPGNNSISVYLPFDKVSDKCLVRIEDANNPSLYKISDNVFRITSANKSILVTLPNSSSYLVSGSIASITWNSYQVKSVSIDFSTDTAVTWTNIKKNVASYDGSNSMNWTVPALSDIYKSSLVRIYDTDTFGISNMFTLSNRYPSSEARLSALIVDGAQIDSFSNTKYNYYYFIPFGTDTPPQISGTPVDANAKAITTNSSIAPGTSWIDIIAEDGKTTKRYSVNFLQKAPSNDAYLKEIRIDSIVMNGFAQGTFSYNFELPQYYQKVPVVSATATTNGQKIKITQAKTNSGTATVDVTSQNDSVTNTYSIAFNVKSFDVIADGSVAINEHSPLNDTVFTLPVNNWIVERPLKFSFVSGNLDNAFAIDNTGAITIAKPGDLNYHNIKSYVLKVKAVPSDDNSKSDIATITVTLKRVYEKPTLVIPALSIVENANAGDVVETIGSTIFDNETVNIIYKIIAGNDSNAFSINAISGVLKVLTPSKLNYNYNKSYTLTFVAEYTKSSVNYGDTVVATVSIIDFNYPVTIPDNQVFSVKESATVGTVIGTIQIVDQDFGEKHKFSLFGDDFNAFNLNDSTGELTVADGSTIKFDGTNPYSLTISVNDGEALNNITLNVENINHAPVMTGKTFSIPEGRQSGDPAGSVSGATVGTITATDKDLNNINYSIIGGNSGEFEIDSITGIIKVLDQTQLVYDLLKSYNLVINAEDDGIPSLSVQATVKVNLTKVNHAPIISAATYHVYEKSAPGTFVGMVNASDRDSSAVLTYTLSNVSPVGGTNVFTINSSTGNITVIDSAKLDHKNIPIVTFDITVSDGSLTAKAKITIIVDLALDTKPVIQLPALLISEDAKIGDQIGTITVNDLENDKVQYAIVSGNDSNVFSLDAATGLLSVLTPALLNYNSYKSYVLQISAIEYQRTIKLGDTVTATVTIQDVNYPVQVLPQTFSVIENSVNGTVVGTVKISDADLNETHFFTLNNDDQGVFSIDTITGIITVAKGSLIDYLVQKVYNLTVTVTDNGLANNTSISAVTINVTTTNHAPVLNDTTFTIEEGKVLPSDEGSVKDAEIGMLEGSDIDVGSVLKYKIISGNSNNAIKLDSLSGDMTVANPLALIYDLTAKLNIVVGVTDNDKTNPKTANANVVINLTKVNHAPIAYNDTVHVKEKSAVGTVVDVFKATERDSGQVLSYAITYASTQNLFKIDATKGIISVIDSANLDYKKTSLVTLKVTATDNGNGKLSATALVLVNIDKVVLNGVLADFESSIDNASLTVTFNDLSSPNVTSWYWTFGDGKSFLGKTVPHKYLKAGLYNVCLTAVDANDGYSDKVCKNVQVGKPTCIMAANYSYSIGGDTLQLTDLSKGAVSNRYWNFGDGITSSEANPSHVYKESGFYLVSISASDSGNKCTDYFAQLLQIGNVECHANFNYTAVTSTKTATFTNQSDGATFYYWDFDDGTYSVEASPSKVFDKEGLYNVSLTISNKTLTCMDNIVLPVQVGSVSCSAEFTYYVDSSSNTAYFKDESLGESTNVLWSFGDGKASIEQNPSHKYAFQGYHTVGLNTYNSSSGCMDYFETPVLIGSENNDCQADFAYQVNPDTRKVRFTDKSKGNIKFWVWNYGDGTMSMGNDTTNHTYSKIGFYNVCLTAINTNFISNINCEKIGVGTTSLNSCAADFIYNIDTLTKTASFTDNSKGKPDTWEWNFGDSTNATSQSPQHIYKKAGYYLVSFKVTNSITKKFDKTYKLLDINQFDGGLKVAFGSQSDSFSAKAGGYPVDFVGAGLGDQSRLKWSFGDGSSGDTTTMSPTHVYTKEGTYYVCYTVSDPISGQTAESCGNISTTTVAACTNDKVKPVANCKNVTLTLDGTGNATLTTDQVDNNSTDDCGIKSYTLLKTNFTTANIGDNKVLFIVTDNADNSDTCETTITVKNGTAVNGTNLVSNFTAYPNPFSNSTTIVYQLNNSTTVDLDVLDLSGRRLTTITNAFKDSGNHSLIWDGSGLESGSYILQLRTSDGISKSRIVVKR